MPERPSIDAARLRAAIDASGLSDRQFAVTVLRVNERTVRRWLAGASSIRDRSLRAKVARLAARAEAERS